MPKVMFAAIVLALGWAHSTWAAAAPVQTGDPAKRGLTQADFPRLKQIEPNVYTFEALRPIEQGFKTTVDLIVVTKQGVLVADGQGNEGDGRALVAAIASITAQPIKYVVICSEHPDHTGGNAAFKAAFPNVVFISSPVSQKALADTATPPTETVADRRTLKLGTVNIDILNLGRSHTGGDLAVHVPGSRVLFLSETYVHRLFPSMRAAYPSEWLATLAKAQKVDATWYIAGHGFVDDAPTMKAELETYRQALSFVIGEAKRLHDAGLPCVSPTDCVAASQANWGPYVDWTERQFQAPVAILRVYQELDGKLP